ncbi:L-rhamnose mutarotase [Candidatus Poribacteria bacterium]|nr:L-rhamnose mutarotase [Candidatus Poribacteria bacterium]
MQRVAFVMRVKEEQQEEYIRRHQRVWQEVLADLKRSGVHQNSSGWRPHLFRMGRKSHLLFCLQNIVIILKLSCPSWEPLTPVRGSHTHPLKRI